MPISRSREFAADEEGARISQKPWALASYWKNWNMEALSLPTKKRRYTAIPGSCTRMFIVKPA
ncbi:MAG: hypothetical protein R2741_07420 [Methanolobus sp.]